MHSRNTNTGIELRKLKNEEDQLLVNKITACAYVLESVSMHPNPVPFAEPIVKPILSERDKLKVKVKLLSLVSKL
jgi:hypothetical protein